jgi:hypothetical protein
MNGTYKAPIKGYYKIDVVVKKAIPTGELETVENLDRKWWQVWKPKMVVREKIIYETIIEGSSVEYLEAGQKVEFKATRIGS